MNVRPLAALAVVALAVAGCAGGEATPTGGGSPSAAGSPDASAPPEATATAAATAAPTGPPRAALEERLEAEIDVMGADFPVAAFDALWVVGADRPEPAIERIDPATNEVVATILVPGRTCNGAVAGADAIWACSADGVVRIDPATNAVVTVIPFAVTGAQARLAFGAESVWVLAGAAFPDSVARIDPATNAVTATIPLGHRASTISFGFDRLWVTSATDGLLLTVDPATNAVTTATAGLPAPFFVTTGEGSVWVTLHANPDEPAPADAPTLLRLDPVTLEVEAEIDAGTFGETGAVAAAEGMVWVRNADLFLAEIDPATNQVVEIIEATQGGGDLTIAYGSVWPTSYDFHNVWRVEP